MTSWEVLNEECTLTLTQMRDVVLSVVHSHEGFAIVRESQPFQMRHDTGILRLCMSLQLNNGQSIEIQEPFVRWLGVGAMYYAGIVSISQRKVDLAYVSNQGQIEEYLLANLNTPEYFSRMAAERARSKAIEAIRVQAKAMAAELIAQAVSKMVVVVRDPIMDDTTALEMMETSLIDAVHTYAKQSRAHLRRL